jgi:hypothetical protein
MQIGDAVSEDTADLCVQILDGMLGNQHFGAHPFCVTAVTVI